MLPTLMAVTPHTNLGKVLYEYLKALPEDTTKTADDFFAEAGIAVEARSDFAWAAILKSYVEYKGTVENAEQKSNVSGSS